MIDLKMEVYCVRSATARGMGVVDPWHTNRVVPMVVVDDGCGGFDAYLPGDFRESARCECGMAVFMRPVGVLAGDPPPRLQIHAHTRPPGSPR